MLLTNESDYSLRIIRALADGEKQTVKAISETELIPFNFAYKILKKMEKAGITQSIHGPGGGYRLVKPLDSLSLYDVISAVEEDVLVFQCLRSDRQCQRDPGGNMCTVHMEFARIQELLVNEMKAKTMKEILESKNLIKEGCPEDMR